MNKQGESGIEVWRDVPGYESVYQVSDRGSVKRLAGSPKCKSDRLLAPNYTMGGYLNISLSLGSKIRQIGVHQLVMWAFVGPQGSLWVHHKNGVKDDNRLENLKYVTPGQNTKHAYDSGLNQGPVGEKNGMAKLTEEDIYLIRLARNLCGEELTRKDMAAYFEVSKTTITEIINGNSWRHL